MIRFIALLPTLLLVGIYFRWSRCGAIQKILVATACVAVAAAITPVVKSNPPLNHVSAALLRVGQIQGAPAAAGVAFILSVIAFLQGVTYEKSADGKGVKDGEEVIT